jgi:predicted RNA-binding Zn ribbon-like protein
MGSDALHTFDLCGGYLAIDFANTVDARETSAPIERLTGYEALVGFSEQSGILAPERAGALRAWAAREPERARAIAAGAIELREALYRLFAALARQQPPPAAELSTLNRWWRSLELGPDFRWRWAAGADAPDSLLGQVLVSAVDLLTSARRERVRSCGAETCLWLFLDTSKNGSRRWCDMNQCGNRTKARRFYRRQRDASESR